MFRYILQAGGVNPPAPREAVPTGMGGPPDHGGKLKNGFPQHPRMISLVRIGVVCLVLLFAAADAAAAVATINAAQDTYIMLKAPNDRQ